MVCIVPHFIIFLYNNHTYIRIQAWLCMPQIGIWPISNFSANLSIWGHGWILSKRYVKGTYDCMRRCKTVEDGCTRSNNTLCVVWGAFSGHLRVANYGMKKRGTTSSVAFLWLKLLARSTLKNCENWSRRNVTGVIVFCIYIKYTKNITRWLIRR